METIKIVCTIQLEILNEGEIQADLQGNWRPVFEYNLWK
jgi:hypothetical protein